LKGQEKISEEQWKSKKALSVFKYLAANWEKRLIPREVLMELLWPEGDPESAAKNLNMALTSLRRTLEPSGARGRSSYILSSGESLHLELGTGGWVDTKIFSDKLLEAQEAKAVGNHDRYLKVMHEAEELYRGDFLEEDLYEDWCIGMRESLKEEHHRLLGDISSEYLRRGEYSEALRYAEKALEVDPGREGHYRGQMEIYSSMGDRAGIERAFKRCSDYLKDNFDVSPSRETEELYHKLRRQ
jgi:LuxR family maltose regulon positive regulatory protein